MLLDRRISISRPSTTRGDYGEVTGASALVTTVACNVRFTTGKVSQGEAGKDITATEIDFTIRYRSDVGVTNTVIFENQNYSIIYVEEIGRRAFKRLKCRRLV